MTEFVVVGVRDAADVSAARLLVREVADTISMPSETAERAAIVASELATNQVRYAGCGRVGVRAIERDGIPGIEVDADDEGPGLSDPTRAFGGEGGGTQGTLGIGLASVRASPRRSISTHGSGREPGFSRASSRVRCAVVRA